MGYAKITDKYRLDWLARAGPYLLDWSCSGGLLSQYITTWGASTGRGPRGAIDAAIKAERKTRGTAGMMAKVARADRRRRRG